ncbi:UDP-glycosyltransferase UGT5 isoform X1 [Dendroctonus ponderosae]|uniref:UDP-glucuronosyltransferase n=2 Tax=Dendroctonus ponderosae TaxID=77166 RepID=J3JVI3_DENPD|nr:UDP-glycosyltransferase UGT5 isoform X1 [Dendroctonus ponderosae]AEE62213.1 unknown [Dendroctonus ponderosae]
MKLLYTLFLLISGLFVTVPISYAYNILVIFGHPGKSHYDVFKPLFQELGNRGHNITIISHVKTTGDIKNGRDVLLSDKPLVNFLNLSDFPGNHLQRYLEAHMIGYFADLTCEPSLQSEELQNFLKEDNQFDIILTEMFNTNCFFGLINKFQAPFIGLSSCAMMAWHPDWFGSPNNPSYNSMTYMAYPVPMTFLQRVENTLMYIENVLEYKFMMEWSGRKLSLQYTGFEPVDPHKASLLLLNTHYSLHGAKPLTPSIVEVGGIHVVSKKPKKLPVDIEKWTNEATSGLIYFSLGSLVKGHTFPDLQLKAFIKAFSKLPQKVLWKWEIDDMPGKPGNIMLTKWAPQFDILCHPNTVLFISHGGLLGTTEAVHCGVPMLVMPQFGDQPLNAEALKSNGAGVILKLRDATEDSISEAISEAMSTKTKTKAKDLSERFKDRLVSPLETSIFWIEYIAKHKGGQSLQSASIAMPFYQYFLLDVIAFTVLALFLFLFIIFESICLFARRFFGKPKTKLL